MAKAFHSVGGLFVRHASALGKDVLRLELSPSDNESLDFFKHVKALKEDGGLVVDMPLEMLEAMVPAEEFGTRDHKIAMLQGTCVNLRVASPDSDRKVKVLDATTDLSYVVAGNAKTGFRPTFKFNRLFRQYVSDVSGSFAFNHIRMFFRNNGGFLFPNEGGGPLKPLEKDLLRILVPYSRRLCQSAEEAREPGHASFNGDFLAAERRPGSLAAVLAAEGAFAASTPNSLIHGKVTLSDILGATEGQWMNAAGRKLDGALKQTQRLEHALDSFDNYVRTQLPQRIEEIYAERLGKPLSNAQREEIRTLFEKYQEDLLVDCRRKLQPLDAFCSASGPARQTSSEHGLAVLFHLTQEYKPAVSGRIVTSDGVELDFSRELSQLIRDPRCFGVENPDKELSVQQAAQIAVINHVSRELLRAYWGINDPIPCTSALQALQAENERKVTDRFTKTRLPVSDPAALFRKFDEARKLVATCVSDHLTSCPNEMATPPGSLFQRLSAQSAGVPEVSRARGLLLRSACALFSRVADEQAGSLLKEFSILTGRPMDECRRETEFLAQHCRISRAQAVVSLALHHAIETNNQRLAEKLDEFGKQNIPEFQAMLEAALDSRVRLQSLTPAALARLVSDAPEKAVHALGPQARVEAELADAKTAAVAGAAMKALHLTLRRSLEFFKTSLPSAIEFKNIEGAVYSGPQSARIVSELVEKSLDDSLADYFRLASISDPQAREHQMNVEAATLAERVEQAKDAVEIEADSRCYPSGRSPKRIAQDLLSQAFNKALLGSGGFKVDPFTFAPPAMA